MYLEELFLHIENGVEDTIITSSGRIHTHTKKTSSGRGMQLENLGCSASQKIVLAMCVIAYGVLDDAKNEYLRIVEEVSVGSVRNFAKVVIEVFGDECLRAPNADDIVRLPETGTSTWFLVMLTWTDCMQWRRKNCPSACHGKIT